MTHALDRRQFVPTRSVPDLPCQLHFEPLRPEAQSVDIPCDRRGQVAIDALGERLRNNYFFARACIGRLFAAPVLRERTPACQIPGAA